MPKSAEDEPDSPADSTEHTRAAYLPDHDEQQEPEGGVPARGDERVRPPRPGEPAHSDAGRRRAEPAAGRSGGLDEAAVDGEFVDDFPQRPGVTTAASVASASATLTYARYPSPLPSPVDLAAYAALDATIPDRLMKLLEDEQAHRHRQDDEEVNIAKTGQAVTFFLVFVALLFSLILGLTGHQAIGIAIGTTTIATVGGIFAFSRRPA